MKNYLNNRYQRVLINNKKYNTSTTLSKWSEIKYDVPQGSILGTLLFLLYINDLPKIINKESVTILLADDTSTLFMHSNPTDFNTNNHKVFEI